VAGLALSLPLQPLLLRWAQNSSGDPRILIAAVLLFLASAAAACIGPALRAASVDPMEALRYE
jgi:ABC-type antimicrobial peptide transport system permease subunit